MLHKFYSFYLAALMVFATPITKAQTPLSISGTAANSLKPSALIQKINNNWYVELDLTAQTNSPSNSWIKIPGRFGSDLRLWLTNGMELSSTNLIILNNRNLPKQTTVSGILNTFHPANMRGLQWWHTGFDGTKNGDFFPLANFDLRDAFNVSFTNDVVLEMTPLIYKVETNEISADLMKFPPIRLKLEASGNVQQIN